MIIDGNDIGERNMCVFCNDNYMMNDTFASSQLAKSPLNVRQRSR